VLIEGLRDRREGVRCLLIRGGLGIGEVKVKGVQGDGEED